MTLEFVVITRGRFGSVQRTLIIAEALRAPKRHVPLVAVARLVFSYIYTNSSLSSLPHAALSSHTERTPIISINIVIVIDFY